MDIIALEYMSRPVAAVGPEIFHIALISSKAWIAETKEKKKEMSVKFGLTDYVAVFDRLKLCLNIICGIFMKSGQVVHECTCVSFC